MFRSAVNSPNRVFLNSQNDTAQTEFQPGNPFYGYFNKYRINFKTPILNPKKVMLVRTAVPTTALNIPDYMGLFALYVVPSQGGLGLQPDTTQFTTANLHWIAFNPYSPYTNTSVTSAYAAATHNRPIANYTDFVSFLNSLAYARANTAGSPGGVDTFWSSVTFVLNSQNNTIQINTTAPGGPYTNYFVCVPGYNDPNIATLANTLNNTYGYNFLPYYPLSLRVGYTSPNTPQSAIPGLCAPLGSTAGLNSATLVPQGFPDLVYTQNVYFYSSIVAGSSTTSVGRQNLLGIVDMAVPPLGVSLFDAQTIQFLDSHVREIFEIDIEMRDDNDQPYNLPDNAIVNVELSFYYDSQ